MKLSNFTHYFFGKILRGSKFIKLTTDLVNNKLVIEVRNNDLAYYILKNEYGCNAEWEVLGCVYLYEEPEVVAFFYLLDSGLINLSLAMRMCEKLPRSKFVSTLQEEFFNFIFRKMVGSDDGDEAE